MQTLHTPTASTWDSFKDTLYKVLEAIKPKTVFEYGPGVSTSIMAMHPSVEWIDTVEHDKAWYEKYRWEMPDNVKFHFQSVMELYPEVQGRYEKYDLIFVDGRERETCLFIAHGRLNQDGVVILHDAERPNYRDMINTYKFKFFTDDGHTVVLTDSHYMGNVLGDALYD